MGSYPRINVSTKLRSPETVQDVQDLDRTLLVTCGNCKHTSAIDLMKLVAAGYACSRLTDLLFMCTRCGGMETATSVR